MIDDGLVLKSNKREVGFNIPYVRHYKPFSKLQLLLVVQSEIDNYIEIRPG